MPDVTGGTNPPKLFVQMDWYAQPDHGGYYQALQKGFYRDAGLDVTILESGPGIAGGQRIAVGTVQFGIGQSDELIVEVGRDVPVVAVSAQMQHVPMALLLHRESPVNTFADLQGKPVMTVPGANWIIYLQRRYHIEFPIIPLNYRHGPVHGRPELHPAVFHHERAVLRREKRRPRQDPPAFRLRFRSLPRTRRQRDFVAQHPQDHPRFSWRPRFTAGSTT